MCQTSFVMVSEELEQRSAQRRQQPTILIAEDDDGHAALIERNLKRCGLTNTCIRFRDGQETLDFFMKSNKRRFQPGREKYLLLLDIQMPKVDGREVLRQMKDHRILRTIPVAIVTTTEDSQELEQFQTLGCAHYLKKPVDKEKLLGVLHQLSLQG